MQSLLEYTRLIQIRKDVLGIPFVDVSTGSCGSWRSVFSVTGLVGRGILELRRHSCRNGNSGTLVEPVKMMMISVWYRVLRRAETGTFVYLARKIYVAVEHPHAFFKHFTRFLARVKLSNVLGARGARVKLSNRDSLVLRRTNSKMKPGSVFFLLTRRLTN